MDTNYRSLADVEHYTLEGETIDPRHDGLDPRQIDDVLKLSHARHVTVRGCVVRAGGLQRENALDLNRECHDVVIADTLLQAGRQNAVTIKGGCTSVILRRVRIDPGQGHCDIELGNWSDQSARPVRDVTLDDVIRTDGRPVRVRVGHAERPTVIGGNVKILFWASLALKLYWWAKFCAHKATRKSPTV